MKWRKRGDEEKKEEKKRKEKEKTPRTQRHQKVLLREKLDTVQLVRGAGVHEVAALLVEARDLKNIDDVVDIALAEAELHDGPGQVGVAVVVVAALLAAAARPRLGAGAGGEDGVDVGVAARPQQVVDPPAALVDAVPRQRVVEDGGQRPHVGQARPQAVVRAHVRGVELPRARGPEALTRVVGVPDVQVAWWL